MLGLVVLAAGLAAQPQIQPLSREFEVLALVNKSLAPLDARPDLTWELRYREFCKEWLRFETARQGGKFDQKAWAKLRKMAKELFQ
jgi:hypothetical protein